MPLDEREADVDHDPAAQEARLREQIIQRELLFQAARRAGLDKRPGVASEAEAARRKVLAEAEAVRQTIVIRRYAEFYVQQHPVADADLRALYDRMRSAGTGLEYKAHHVLFATRPEADAMVRALSTGASFEDLARKSADTAAQAKGGDLGSDLAETDRSPASSRRGRVPLASD